MKTPPGMRHGRGENRCCRASELNSKSSSLQELLKNLVTLLNEEASSQNIHIQVEMNSDLPFVKMDSKKLTQAFMNIMKNGMQAMEKGGILLRYPYPGNARELENLIERAVVLCRGDVITTQDLPFHLQEGKPERSWEAQKTVRSLPESLEEIERDLIVKALHEHKRIQIKAAEGLGISERVLRYKIKKYRIRFNEEKE